MSFISGHYYRLPSNRLSEGDRAYSVLHDLNHNATTGLYLTMKLYYHTKTDIGGLTISLTRMTRSPIPVYTTHTDSSHSMDWEEIRICLPPGNFSLLLTATQGDETSSDLAIDDIKLTDITCYNYTVLSGMLTSFYI